MLRLTLRLTVETQVFNPPGASRSWTTLSDDVSAISPMRDSSARAQAGPPSHTVLDEPELTVKSGVSLLIVMSIDVSDLATIPGKSIGVVTSHRCTLLRGPPASTRRELSACDMRIRIACSSANHSPMGLAPTGKGSVTAS
eukprot:CAMPEP_0183382640 /NCGR_PEP_ID=MMETSP0164_2-20130417/127050_1 /TAXON_ID=221442 /ORGANISM="Coccolithus pelagicus ssp braarudi, Strain PLY182g" /LENGTH=140 /DNA_ID=CAMNT_0025560263 /DNA_START=1106 /DNA_END=1528 /DNA_ORIENTATION=-